MKRTLSAALLLLSASDVGAEAVPWSCSLCMVPEPLLEVSAGATVVASPEERYGPYAPWSSDGVLPRIGFQYRDRSAADYLALDFDALGEDRVGLELQGGEQGRIESWLSYRSFPYHSLWGGVTPYRDVGGDRLALPADWVDGATTREMTALPALADEVEIGGVRRTLAVGGRWFASPRWEYRLEAAEQQKEGTTSLGAIFGTSFADAQAVIVPAPVDYRTRSLEAGAYYRGLRTDWSFSYYASLFDNADDSLTWENAFGATPAEGLLGLPPDNRFHQLRLEGRYRADAAAVASWRLAYGQSLQDEPFADYAVASTAALPRSDLDGRIDSWVTDFAYLYPVTRQFSVRAFYNQEEQDNQTPRALYDYVIADTTTASQSRANLPFSLRKRRYGASLGWEWSSDRLNGVVSQTRDERTYREVEQTTDNRIELEWSHLLAGGTMHLRAERSDRTHDGYTPLADGVPEENPLLEKYTLANRVRDAASFRIDAGGEVWSGGAELLFASADYRTSEIGLTDSTERSVAADISRRLGPASQATLHLGRQTFDSTQSGSAAFAGPDWRVRIEDIVDSTGVSWRLDPASRPWAVQVRYDWSRYRGETRLDEAMPTVSGTTQTAVVQGEYALTRRSQLDIALLYAVHHERDWMRDVEPDTVSNVLALGGTQEYEYVATYLSYSRHY